MIPQLARNGSISTRKSVGPCDCQRRLGWQRLSETAGNPQSEDAQEQETARQYPRAIPRETGRQEQAIARQEEDGYE